MAKLVIKVSQVPDWGRRAIRLSLALTFFTTIAIWLWPVPGECYLRLVGAVVGVRRHQAGGGARDTNTPGGLLSLRWVSCS
jgi:hypothetical protein